jgi:hypothetical protein
MASSSTPSGSLTSTQPSSAELSDAVRHWVHFDNLAESLNKQINNVRTLRSQYESRVLELLEGAGLKKANLKITGATLSCATRYKQNDLSWTLLEDQLHDYFKSRGQRDDTKDVLGFLQRHRGGRTVEYLKKTSMTQSSASTTPPPVGSTGK